MNNTLIKLKISDIHFLFMYIFQFYFVSFFPVVIYVPWWIFIDSTGHIIMHIF